MVNKEEESLIEFPCDFPIKVMGKAEDEFDAFVVSLIRRHSPDIKEGAVSSRHSNGGRYISVTVTIQAQSREQLDSIYMDLTSEKKY